MRQDSIQQAHTEVRCGPGPGLGHQDTGGWQLRCSRNGMEETQQSNARWVGQVPVARRLELGSFIRPTFEGLWGSGKDNDCCPRSSGWVETRCACPLPPCQAEGARAFRGRGAGFHPGDARKQCGSLELLPGSSSLCLTLAVPLTQPSLCPRVII